jgi:WD40 repeat protein
MVGNAWAQSAARLGMFEGATDVGKVSQAGAVEFRPDRREYIVTGGGANIWGTEDAFRFVWRKLTGDLALTASVRWQKEGGNAHRKAGWMIRQSLEADSPYVDAVIHGDGLTSLQYRQVKGGPTEEIQSPLKAPAAIQLERHGDVFTLSVSREGKAYQPVGSLGLDDGPEYSPDGRYIYFNSERTGLMRIWRMKADGSEQEQVTLDPDWADWFAHPSPDGKTLLFLSYSKDVKGHPENQDVVLRIMPVSGGKPRVLARLFGGQGTINVPSWSPDSRFAAFVSYRLVAP